MSNHMMANGLVQTWVPVIDSQGQSRLEAHWVAAGAPATHVTHAA